MDDENEIDMSDDNEDNTFLPEEGKPYFCIDCKRTHVKGKIYRTHLAFARESQSKYQLELFKSYDKINYYEEIIDDETEHNKEERNFSK